MERAVTQPDSVTTTARARSSSRGMTSTRPTVVCLRGGVSRSAVSLVTLDSCDEVRSMNPSMPVERDGRPSADTGVGTGGGTAST